MKENKEEKGSLDLITVNIVVDKGLIDEEKGEIKETISRLNTSELTTQTDEENCEERIITSLKDEEISRLQEEGKVYKRLEVIMNETHKPNLNSINGKTYKIKTKEYENVKDILSKVKEFINLDKLKLDLKKPEIIIEYDEKEKQAKAIIKQSKREYFVFAHSRSIRPNIIRGLIIRAGLNKSLPEGTAIDLTSISPFCLEAGEVNKNIKLLSWSWSSRITNLMRKNCLVARNKRVEFDHGILNELLKKHKEKMTGNIFVFGQFLFVNEKVLGEIIKTLNRIKNEEGKSVRFILIFDKQLSEEFIKTNNMKESLICQGKRKLYTYSSL